MINKITPIVNFLRLAVTFYMQFTYKPLAAIQIAQ